MSTYESVAPSVVDDVPLAWARKDIEQRLMFRGGRHTNVNSLLAFVLAVIISLVFYAALLPFQETYFAIAFLDMGSVPYSIVLFSAWSVAILFLKWRKLALQRQALRYTVVPTDPTFVLSGANVDRVVDEIYKIVDEPANFVLFNRIMVALANLKNLGRVGDVDEILRSQSDSDAESSESSYGIIGGFVWAIPVLGFIGTVLGLSGAIGKFGTIMEAADSMEGIKDGLREVTKDLATAFVTTLQALVAALFIQLALTFLKKDEQEFLEQCGEYCTNQIVNRLRIMPFERVRE